MTTRFHRMAEQQGIPLRTIKQVKVDLAKARENHCEAEVARLMLRHGRLTDDARAYLTRAYPQ